MITEEQPTDRRQRTNTENQYDTAVPRNSYFFFSVEEQNKMNNTENKDKETIQRSILEESYRGTVQKNSAKEHHRGAVQGNSTEVQHRGALQGNSTEEHHRGAVQGNSTEEYHIGTQ